MSNWKVVLVSEHGQVLEAFSEEQESYGEGLVVVLDTPSSFDPSLVKIIDKKVVNIPPMLDPMSLFDYEKDIWVPAEIATLEQEKFKTKKKIMSTVSEYRSSFLSPITGQSEVYAAKRAEALSFISSEKQELSWYPLIQAEIGFSGETAEQVASVWLNMAHLQAVGFAKIEKARLQAMEDLSSSETVDQVSLTFSKLLDKIK
jgi:hypothetical protein